MESNRRRQLKQDLLLVTASVFVAIFFVSTGAASRFIYSLGGLELLGAFFAGLFFTSVFTTAPAIALIGVLAESQNIIVLALVGGVGSAVGDYIIFRFVRDRISEDINYLLSFSEKRRFARVFESRLFRFFVPFLGALLIASPFPDEIGVALLGVSKVRTSIFLPLSFILNGLGILAISWIVAQVFI